MIFVLNSSHHKPVEQCFAKVPSVELPTKLVQIVLTVLRANVVIDIQQQSLCIGNRNMHPRAAADKAGSTVDDDERDEDFPPEEEDASEEVDDGAT